MNIFDKWGNRVLKSIAEMKVDPNYPDDAAQKILDDIIDGTKELLKFTKEYTVWDIKTWEKKVKIIQDNLDKARKDLDNW